MNENQEIETVNLLSEILGSGGQAKVLLFLQENSPSYAMDIEHSVRMRQPEVSVATKELENKNFIIIEKSKTQQGKGRPRYIYNLNKKVKEKLLKLVDARTVEVNKIKDAVEEAF